MGFVRYMMIYVRVICACYMCVLYVYVRMYVCVCLCVWLFQAKKADRKARAGLEEQIKQLTGWDK